MTGATWPQDGHLVVLGQTGLGKTAFVRAWLRTMGSLPVYPRVVIADKDAEYGAVAVGIGTIDELAAYVERTAPPWRIAYQGDDLDAAMPVLAEATYQIGNTLLIAEEADLWCSPASIIPELAHVLKYGRKRGAWVCSVARRASELHRLATSQARHLIAFGTVEPIDVEYLRRAVGPEFAGAVQTLEPLQGAWWDRRERALVYVRVIPAELRIVRLERRKEPAAGA